MQMIDRKALIADYRICGGCSDFENCSGHITMCDSARIRQAINEAPTIEAEPVRHGRWIVKGQEIYCSECNEESLYNSFGASKFSRFCPNCGARMDGGADNDSE